MSNPEQKPKPRIPYYLKGQMYDLGDVFDKILPPALNRTLAIESGIKIAKYMWGTIGIQREGFPVLFSETYQILVDKYPQASPADLNELASALVASGRATWDHLGSIRERK